MLCHLTMLGICGYNQRPRRLENYSWSTVYIQSSIQRSWVTLNTLSRLFLIHWFIRDFGMVILGWLWNKCFKKAQQSMGGFLNEVILITYKYVYHWNLVKMKHCRLCKELVRLLLETTIFPKSYSLAILTYSSSYDNTSCISDDSWTSVHISCMCMMNGQCMSM